MKLLLKIAYFNLWRRKSRSFLVIAMIAISITGLLLIQGLYQGMIKQLIDNSLRSDSGHISIYNKNYRTTKSLDDQIQDPQKIVTLIKAYPEVKSVLTRIKHEGLVATAKHSQGALFIGTDLAEEERHAHLKNYLKQGTYSFGKRKRKALIGSNLAKKLKVRIGQKIIITVQDKTKEINSVILRVAGIVKTNNIGIDRMGVLMDKEKLSKLLALGKAQTQISIFVTKRALQAPLQKKLSKQLAPIDPKLRVYSWTELFPMFDMIEEMQVTFFVISYGLVFIIASLGIFGVILVSVLERVREFGIMLAIGSSFSRIRWQIIAESVFLGLFGLLIGSILGGLLLYYFSEIGIDMRAYSEGMSKFGMDAILKADFEWSYFTSSGVAVVLATFFAALWPIRVLKKLNPIEAVNEN